jgi:hypothetical protein
VDSSPLGSPATWRYNIYNFIALVSTLLPCPCRALRVDLVLKVPNFLGMASYFTSILASPCAIAIFSSKRPSGVLTLGRPSYTRSMAHPKIIMVSALLFVLLLGPMAQPCEFPCSVASQPCQNVSRALNAAHSGLRQSHCALSQTRFTTAR